MKICRVILNLPKSKKAIFQGGDPWKNHRKTLKEMFLSDKKAYKERIKSIAAHAEENGADILLLPACTFVYETPQELAAYLRMIPPKITVSSGILKIDGHGFVEEAVWHDAQHGKIVFNSDYVQAVPFRKTYLYAALSSTIAGLHNEKEPVEPDDIVSRAKNICALDMGHHQYGGRYMLTLKAVQRHLKRRFKGKHSVILAFWRYDKWNTHSPWMATDNAKILDRTEMDDNLVDLIEV